MAERGMVIVGAGEAGARAAVELREQGWKGSVTLIGEERLVPYERPPLSKSILLGEEEPKPVFILDTRKMVQHDIQLLSNCAVTKIDRDNQTVILADGQRIAYERLLLATGSRPRRLSLNGCDHENVLYLRTFSDALAIRERLKPGKHIAIIGGGFIGLETAASAVERGCSVTLIEVGARIMRRGVSKEIADIVQARHRAAGVQFRIGDSIDRIEPCEDRLSVVLAAGAAIDCDAVIIGIGAIPETSLAADCGLEIENGVRVDEMLRTSDPNIFAGGDCCSFPHRLYAGRRIRLEAWRNAQDQGSLAARNMLGAEEPYTTVPWFWSDQYEQTLQVAGLADYGEVIVNRDIGDEGKFFFHLTYDGRLVAVSAVGPISKIAKDIRLAEMLIHQQAHPDLNALANPDVKLKTLL